MDKVIESVNFDASEDLISRIDSIFDDLNKYNDQIVSSDIYLKVMNERSEKDKNIRIKVFLPGEDLFVEHEAEDFISAAQQLYDKVKRLLIDQNKRHKDPRQPRPDKV